ncbi:MAG: glycosyltransferase, partial [Deltaproteobacteria bacterium]|nr:glycosyltransferase [Deltaproteobacteria bacterium]
SWGNGHATIWRGLSRGLAVRGHRVVFFEKDVPYYAAHRDMTEPPGAELVLYASWEDIRKRAEAELDGADAGIVTSYCPDAVQACSLVLSSKATVRCFYDLDTPITLKAVESTGAVPYLPSYGLGAFDLVLSYTGGQALKGLEVLLGAKNVHALYGSVDQQAHSPAAAVKEYAADLSYLGTYAEDRQEALKSLFVEPAARLPDKKFIIGGAQYPMDFPWLPNIYFVRHVPPPSHSSFYCSSKFTLNVTRAAMREMGWCPSGRLFEAAACGVPVISDWWEGLDDFFEPGLEIVIARNIEDVLSALDHDEAEIRKIGKRARERVLAGHTSIARALELELLIEKAACVRKGEPCGG